MGQIEIWKFIAGLGLFLYGLFLTEEALKELAGKRFKIFLRKYTTNRFLAILNGLVATAFLRSSSLVLLMVIAFAGAGLISLSNSLGIILGANLGTTLTGWLVSYFGFKTNIESFVLPFIAIGCVGTVFIQRKFPVHYLFNFIFSVGLIFMGLNFIKESVAYLTQSISMGEFQQASLFTFFILGLVFTAIIQSSSAMMSITLTALHAQIIPIESAIFVAIGADLGTTVTGLIASSRGNAIKKRAGLAHFFFNVMTAVIALIFWSPLLKLIQSGFSILDPLYQLVAFHSVFNFVGIIVFFPFLGIFERFLNRFFINDHQWVCKFIHRVETDVPEASLEAIRLELRGFIQKVFQFNTRLMGIHLSKSENETSKTSQFFGDLISKDETIDEYQNIKKIEEELLDYFLSLQKEKLDENEFLSLNQYIQALRNGVQSAKDYKDISHNLKDFQQSTFEEVEYFFQEIHQQYKGTLERTGRLLKRPEKELMFEEMAGIILDNEKAYQRLNDWVYQYHRSHHRPDLMITTFLNVNREIYNGNRLLVEAIEDTLLTSKESKNLSSLPTQ